MAPLYSSPLVWLGRVVVTLAAAALTVPLLWLASPRAPNRGVIGPPSAPIQIVDARSDEAVVRLGRSLRAAEAPEARLLFAGWLVEATAADWSDSARTRFLRSIAPQVLAAAVTEGVLPSLLLAQAAHESGWGKSRIARELDNLFGHTQGDGWRVYPSWAASVAAHARLLGRSDRYAASRSASDWRRALGALAPHYAEDPEYAQRVGSMIRQWRMDRWDDLVRARSA